jgi:hypothetical protein
MSRRVVNSALLRAGGFQIYDGVPEASFCQLLLDEAVGHSASAHESLVAHSDGEEVRGGSPARRFLSVPGGEVQRALYWAPWVGRLLRTLTGMTIEPSGGRGTYTYYARPGDFLALHRDVDTCEIAMITCLADTVDSGQAGGLLTLYPTRLFEPLSSIRSAPHRGAVTVRLSPGQTIVMCGGLVPHCIGPVAAGQVRIVSVLCYQ